jgi:hypothetical protein
MCQDKAAGAQDCRERSQNTYLVPSFHSSDFHCSADSSCILAAAWNRVQGPRCLLDGTVELQAGRRSALQLGRVFVNLPR